MKYRYEGKYKGKHQGEPDAEWHEIDEDLLRSNLRWGHKDIQAIIDSLQAGQIHEGQFTLYRALPVEAVEDPDVLREWFLGEWPKAQTVKEFLAPLIREIVREELAEGRQLAKGDADV